MERPIWAAVVETFDWLIYKPIPIDLSLVSLLFLGKEGDICSDFQQLRVTK